MTNPPQATLGTSINQTSYARLVSINAVDDWCIFAPPEAGVTIGDSEAYEVAWCTQARNNARVIPDGVISGVSLLKTDFYIQVMGYGDLTQINLAAGDYGGELDPHGATGEGNPVGGNVTTNIATGSDTSYEEWMMFISYSQFCFRICTNANETYSAAAMCEHKLDEMGCEFVMPGNYGFNGTFETCDADVAYPPGWYPEVSGGSTSYSQFAQYFTGTNNDGTGYTVGDTVTPSSVAFTPSSSNCQTTSTISNGINLASLGVTSGVLASQASATSKASATASGSTRSSSSGSAASTSSNNAAPGLAAPLKIYHEGMTLCALIAGIAAIALLN